MAIAGLERIKELGQRSVPTFAVRARVGGGSPRVFVAQDRGQDAHEAAAAALKKVRSEFLPRVAETTLGEGHTTLLLEWVDGLTLADVGEPPPLEISLAILLDALSGATALATAGLWHGDICPENVLVGADGIGRLLQLAGGSVAGQRQVSRTVRFLAPEVLLADDAQDARVDVYAIAVLLWEALERAPLFVEMHGSAILSRHLSGKVVAPRAKEDWAAAIAPLCLRGLATDPGARLESARAFADQLRGAARGHLATRAQVAEWVRARAGTRFADRRAALGLPALPGAAKPPVGRVPAAPPPRTLAATAIAIAPKAPLPAPPAKPGVATPVAAPLPATAPVPGTQVAPPVPAKDDVTTAPKVDDEGWVDDALEVESVPPTTTRAETPEVPARPPIRGEPPLRPALAASASGEVAIDLVTDPDEDRESVPPTASRHSDRPTPLLGHEDLSSSLTSAARHTLDRVTHPAPSSLSVPSDARPTAPLIAAPVAAPVVPVVAPVVPVVPVVAPVVPVVAPVVAPAVAPASVHARPDAGPTAMPTSSNPTPTGAIAAVAGPRESDGEPISAPVPTSPSEPRRRRAAVVVLAMVVLAAVFLVVAIAGRRRPTETDDGAKATAKGDKAATGSKGDKGPAVEATQEPTKEPAKEPAKEPTKEPAKEPAKEPTKEPAPPPTVAPVPTPPPVATPGKPVSPGPFPKPQKPPKPTPEGGKYDPMGI